MPSCLSHTHNNGAGWHKPLHNSNSHWTIFRWNWFYKQKASSLCSAAFFIGIAHSSKLDAKTNKKAPTYVEAFCLSGGQDYFQ
jgi:hypothetical protein